MNFQFPGTYAELQEHHFQDHYKVTLKNNAKDMDERIALIRITQLADAFNNLSTIITDPQYFDFFYHLVQHLDHHPNAKVQLQLLETLTFQIQKCQEPESFKMTIFLLLNLMQSKQIQGQQLRRALKTIIQLFSTPNMSLINREGSRYFFDLVKMAQEIKEQSTRDLWIQLLIQSLKTWTTYDSTLRNRIVHLMYEQESVATNIAKLLCGCYEDEKTKMYCIDQVTLIINYITEKSTNQQESIAVKNLREILSQMSKNIPKFFYQQLSGLIQLYDNENYHIRNALSDIIASVIEYLVKDPEDNNHELNINKMIKQLLDRNQDKAALCRSNVLQCLSHLMVNNCIPKIYYQSTFQIASSRLRDISGYVRKAALQLLKSIVKHYRLMFVQSQGREYFFNKEEIEQMLQENQNELDDVQKEFNQIEEKQFDPDQLKQLQRRAQETVKLQAYLEEYLKFIEGMKTILNQVMQLCQSKNQADVIHSIKLFAYLKKYQFPDSQNGINRMLLLIWSQDKSIQTEVLKKFHKLFLRAEKPIPILLELVNQSSKNLKEIVSIEKILQSYEHDGEYKLPGKLFLKLWSTLGNCELRSTCILIRILINKNQEYLNKERIIQLSQLISKQQNNPDWIVIREIAVIMSKCSDQQQNMLDKLIDQLVALLIKHQGCENVSYFSTADAIVQLISLSQHPESLFEFLLQEMAKEGMELEGDKQLFLSHAIYVSGNVSLQLLIYIDGLHNKLKELRNEREKKVGKEQEIDKIQGGFEAEFEKLHELLNRIQDQEIIGKNILQIYSPMVKEIIVNQLENPQYTTLSQISLLTMCKFMCLSESYCRENLNILFQIMHSSQIDQVMKNNIIISIGDLLHRWPNTVQQYHKQIYANLSDSTPTVRRVTLLVLTHLILNDMIKGKTSLQFIPLLLCDPYPSIPPMARYFLNELSKKEQRAISNALPDIIKNVHEQNESIFQQIAQYIDKTQIESIIDRLITVLSNSQNAYEIKNIALVFNLLHLSKESLQKFLDGFEEYREKLHDKYVYDQFQHLIKKYRRTLPQNLHPMVDEFESKVQQHDKETFDGRRREKVSKKKHNRDPKDPKEPKDQKEPVKENNQVKRRKPKQQLQIMELESDSSENMEVELDEDSEVIKKPQRRRLL